MIPPHIAAAFEFQSKACAALGSPFMAQLMRLCAQCDWPAGAVRDRVFAWQGDISPRGQSVPLRLAGALHALRLQGHGALDAAYPPRTCDDATLWQVVTGALRDEADAIQRWLDSPPQTNEVRRAAVLIATGHWLADRFGLPIRTSELGASGGLNLHWDSYALDVAGKTFGPDAPALVLAPDWTGAIPRSTRPEIADRGGVDLNPLDPRAPAGALRLQAYLWPDQPARIANTKAAIAAARTPVAKGDAIDWLHGRIAHVPGQLHLIYSTVAWQYFPAAKQAEGTALIAAAGQSATAQTPLAWFGMENDGGDRGAALTLRVWPGDLALDLGRADFHGRWIDWRDPDIPG